MRRSPLVRGLVWGLAACVLLPIVLSITLGTGGLLAAVGDAAAATVCRRVALGLGILWIAALAATTLASGMLTLTALAEPRGRHGRGGRRPRRRRPPRDAGR
jgi:hypothetical protein